MEGDDSEIELTLTIYGLDQHHSDVDGEVFARKLTAFLRGIRQADKLVNGKRRHKLLLTALKKASASASVREQIIQFGPVPESGMEFYAAAVDSVFQGRPEASQLPVHMLRDIGSLSTGAGHSFSSGTLKSNRGMVVDIGPRLARAAAGLMQQAETLRIAAPMRSRFSGVAFSYFDGVLKLVDLLGETQKAVLVLTAGGKQIECGVDKLSVDQLRAALDRRVVAYGRAHYGPSSGLPERLDVTKAEPVRPLADADLARWRGAFDLSGPTTGEGLH